MDEVRPTLRERFASVQQRIDQAAAKAGRAPSEIRLVAVSKRQSLAKIRQALGFGCREFGENYGQELIAKAEELSDPRARWHFIGHLQRNKVKRVIPRVGCFHALDSLRLLSEIVKTLDQRTSPLEVLIQVNVAGEGQKSGIEPGQLTELVQAVPQHAMLRLTGLMTMPPLDCDPTPHFHELNRLLDRQRAQMEPERAAIFRELSMGMSGDFEQAIACGATMIRLGTILFGPRG